MSTQLAIVMDPIGSIKVHKDSSFAMLLAAQAREWTLIYMEQGDLFLRDGEAFAMTRSLRVIDRTSDWFELGNPEERRLGELDIILMRKDPPLDMEFIYTTHLLEQAERAGALVVNRPSALRNCNEKLFATAVSCLQSTAHGKQTSRCPACFSRASRRCHLQTTGWYGGDFHLSCKRTEHNLSVIIETLTNYGQTQTMAQKHIPEIVQGDTRILLINDESVPYGLARVPQKGETRGNLAAGGSAVGRELNDRTDFICEQVGPVLREKGLYFVGIDVIGDYLT